MLPLTNLRTLLAASSTWQAWVAAANAAAAAERVHLVTVDAAEAQRPFAVVMPGDEWARESVAGGTANCFLANGTLNLAIEADVPAEYAGSHADAAVWFLSKVGAIISEMEDLAASGTYLNVTGIKQLDAIGRSPKSEQKSDGDYFEITFTVSWRS